MVASSDNLLAVYIYAAWIKRSISEFRRSYPFPIEGEEYPKTLSGQRPCLSTDGITVVCRVCGGSPTTRDANEQSSNRRAAQHFDTLVAFGICIYWRLGRGDGTRYIQICVNNSVSCPISPVP